MTKSSKPMTTQERLDRIAWMRLQPTENSLDFLARERVIAEIERGEDLLPGWSDPPPEPSIVDFFRWLLGMRRGDACTIASDSNR